MNVKGVIKLIRETQVVSDKFQKREFVIETFEQYPQVLQFELQGQNCDIIDAYGIGQDVECSLNIWGRMWTNPQGEEKVFNTLVCWKIQPINSENTQEQEKYTGKREITEPLGKENEPEDLPF
jgi:hypothetical protein